MTLTCLCMRHHGPQVLHQVSGSEVDPSGGENQNSFLVGPFALLKNSLAQNIELKQIPVCNFSLKMQQKQRNSVLLLRFRTDMGLPGSFSLSAEGCWSIVYLSCQF